jgi:hypothetical protein
MDSEILNEIKDRFVQLAEAGCSCDLLYGYQCNIHLLLRKNLVWLDTINEQNNRDD